MGNWPFASTGKMWYSKMISNPTLSTTVKEAYNCYPYNFGNQIVVVNTSMKERFNILTEKYFFLQWKD